MTTKHYFCCNPTDDAVLFFDSAEEAEEAARHAIEHATDGDWHPEVFGICWGRVHGSADVDVLHQHGRGSACVEAGSDGHGLCSAGVPLDADYGGEVTLHAHPVDDPTSARIAELEAEVARLNRQNAHLTEEVHDLLARLQEAHRDAEVLAAGENDRWMCIEGFTPYPALESVQGTQDDLFAAMQRAERRAGGAR